jgi:hypothetical protein
MLVVVGELGEENPSSVSPDARMRSRIVGVLHLHQEGLASCRGKRRCR